MNAANIISEEFSQFSIIKTFLGNLQIECCDAPLLIHDIFNNTKINTLTVDVIPVKIGDLPYYYVSIRTHITSSIDDNHITHKLTFNYLAFVEIHNENLDDNSIQQLLNSNVPDHLFNNLNSIVYNATSATSFPIILEKSTFLNSIEEHDTINLFNDDEDTNPEDENSDSDYEMIDYHLIIDNLASLQEFSEFISIYNARIGTNVTDNYETLPVYNYYLRFFIPIEYNHPDLEECDESVWPMLFQLLFGNLDAICRIIDMDEELPEIEFTFNSFHNVRVSDLSLSDLTDLLEELLTDMLITISICLVDYKNINTHYNESLNVDRLIRRKEFFKIYGFDDLELMSNNELDFLEKLYSRIKNCDIQTVLYRY